MKLSTPVICKSGRIVIRPEDKLSVLGSCFADSMGRRLKNSGLDAYVNPFGTLYNPVSVCNAVSRLDSGKKFTVSDCIGMGAGSGLVCSFEHHTSFARPTEAEFLDVANSAMEEASAHWKESGKVLVTLGTAQVWRWSDGRIVSNCLKRPGTEFSHEMLDLETVKALIRGLVSSHPDKEFIFTVSPIRHLGDGAHVNTLSKSILQLGIDSVHEPRCEYFPAYEILLDELRDYRFFADDLVHPSHLAEEIIWERFIETYIPQECHATMRKSEKAVLYSQHKKLH